MTPKSSLREIIGAVTDRGLKMLRRGHPTQSSGNAPVDLVELAEELLSGRGEATGYARARALLELYEQSGPEERLGFLQRLVSEYGAARAALDTAVDAFKKDPTPSRIAALHRAAEPRRQELIRRLNLAPNGTSVLVRMRSELLTHLHRHPELGELDQDFVHLFRSWFNRGFLVMRPIDWRTPACILEKIIQYEAVHAIRGWDDLRRRIDLPDRRCFAFFHPALESEPLIFVEVALTREVPDAIEPLIAAHRRSVDPNEATCATFYSISACQRGLTGISFGNFLIKQVADDLRLALPRLTQFVTLSPVPGFAAWLRRVLEGDSPAGPAGEEVVSLKTILNLPHWWEDAAAASSAKPLIERAAARYFLHEKTTRGLPIDSVARFHLGNGARLERLNHLGDRSAKGLEQSHGLMVNYCYDLSALEEQHEAYAERGVVTASKAVTALLNDEQQRRYRFAKAGASC